MARISSARAVAAVVASALALLPCGAAVADCRLEVVLRDVAGAPARPGLIVRGSAAGWQGEAPWTGARSAVLEHAPCTGVHLDIGWRAFSSNEWHWRPAATADGVAAGSAPTVVTVPVVRRLTTRLFDTNGKPAAGGSLFVIPLTWPDDAARPRGEFLDSDPSGISTTYLEPGTYSVTARVPASIRHLVLEGRDLTAEPALVAADGRSARITLDLLRADATLEVTVDANHPLSGRVRDAQGHGVRGVLVSVVRDGTPEIADTTGPDGTFHVYVDAFPVTLEASDAFESRYEFDPAETVVTSDETAHDLEFVARPRSGPRMNVSVVDEDGHPVPGARIDASMRTRRAGSSAVTGDDGSASVACSPGAALDLQVRPKTGSGLLFERVELAAVDCDHPARVVLERGARLDVLVADGRGRPVAGLEVVAQADVYVPDNRARTDAQGHAVFDALPLHRYRIDNRVDGNAGDAKRLVLARRRRAGADEAWPVTLDLAKGTTELELVATRGSQLCVVTQDANGAPLVSSGLAVHRDPGGPAVRDARSTSTRFEPRSCLGPLLPGRYFVHVGEPMGGAVPLWWPGVADPAEAVAVEVKPGKDLELGPLHMRPSGSIETCCLPPGDESEPLEVALQEVRPEPEERTAAGDEAPTWAAHRPEFVIVTSRKDNASDPEARRVIAHAVPVGHWNVRVCEGTKAGAENERRCWTGTRAVDVKRHAWSTVDLERSPLPAKGAP